MKKSLLIIVLGVGFAFISCEKQDVQPRSSVISTPVWQQSSSVAAPNPGPLVSPGDEGTDGGGITDPNDDEDGNGRKKA